VVRDTHPDDAATDDDDPRAVRLVGRGHGAPPRSGAGDARLDIGRELIGRT
jgi:hypothetical protein